MRTEGSYRIIKLADDNEISCHALMVATGVQWRRLAAPGIDRLQGAGVYYGGGATEALSCKGEDCLCCGGSKFGRSGSDKFRKACGAGSYRRARELSVEHHVTVFDRSNEADAQYPLWPHASVAEVHGETHLAEISFLCSDTNKVERVPATAMFIFIGALPRTE